MVQKTDPIVIPVELGERNRSGFRSKYIVGGLLLLTFVGFLIVQVYHATTTTGAYYLTVGELYERVPQIYGERVRVSGNVVEGSENWNPQEVTLRFQITDESQRVLPIVFYGPRPDNFTRAASAIIEGELLPDGTFQAQTLLLKCPSRYEEEPEEVFVEAVR
ncbi:MAG: cytochrome c maturation protein CcmE [Caldilinea sp.]|nr:cytochrome c maturation protein CcmE [Caldilinea sp.]MDW8441680.1 cytochrome c maturation protein CcmE [Caldilineaceae bacterium]